MASSIIRTGKSRPCLHVASSFQSTMLARSNRRSTSETTTYLGFNVGVNGSELWNLT